MISRMNKYLIYDEVYTPYIAILPLLDFLPRGAVIWEPTDFGGSKITSLLKLFGFKVISSHLESFDFLNDKPDFDFDIIVTNPPYSLKDEFLSRCYSYNKPFALLLPITALAGVKRGDMFRKFGVELLVLDKRVNFLDQKKNCWFNSSWFTYKLLDSTKFVKLDDYMEADIYV